MRTKKIQRNRVYLKHVKLMRPLHNDPCTYIEHREEGQIITHINPLNGQVIVIALSMPYTLGNSIPSYSAHTIGPHTPLAGAKGLQPLLRALELMGFNSVPYD